MKHAIANTAADFNALHNYDMSAAIELASLVVRHAYLVQIARLEKADPQLTLPLDTSGLTFQA